MRQTRSIGQPFRVVLAAVLLVTAGTDALAGQHISTRPIGANSVRYRIEEPNVTQPSTDYQTLTFQPGDKVTVDAGGCVQTGGHGSTWKRYVNPGGRNSDHLYHGLILIPGATGSLVRIQSVIGRALSIPASINPAGLYLRLGYEDDGYGDNSYKDHDDGTDNQCRGTTGGAAWVELLVEHSVPGPIVTQPQPLPFDLIWTAIDDNFMPKNAMWGWQVTHPGQLPNAETQCALQPDKNPCTSQATSRDDAHICGPHANWFPATYEGQLSWESHSASYADDDYNFRLQRDDQAALTSRDAGKGQGLEFNSDETIDHFKTPWWDAFHAAVDRSDAAAGALINGSFAVVSGLVGLDCEHGCNSELHPVYAMAVRVKDTAQDEVWAIFVRNWGNEGFCSSNQHLLPLTTYTFRLPWRGGATDVVPIAGTQFMTNDSKASGPAVQSAMNQGVLVTFTMSDPKEDGTRINGELHLRWAGPAATTMNLPARRVQPVAAQENDAEEKFSRLVETMPQAAHDALLSSQSLKVILPDQIALPAASNVKLSTLPVFIRSAGPAVRVVSQMAPAAQWTGQRQKVIRVVCAAYSGILTGFLGQC